MRSIRKQQDKDRVFGFKEIYYLVNDSNIIGHIPGFLFHVQKP